MTSAGLLPPAWAISARGLTGADGLTYRADLVGISAAPACVESGQAPEGFVGFTRSAVIGEGVDVLAAAGEVILSGQMHRLAGVPLSQDGRPLGQTTRQGVTDTRRMGPGDVVTVHIAGLHCPCLVLDVEQSEQTIRMTYGTLPGHMESGEESFSVHLGDDGRVTATISAFARPGHPLAWVAGAAGRAVQRWMAGRYIRALRPDDAQMPR